MPYREHAHTSFFIQTIYIEMEKKAKTKRQKQKRWWRRRRRSKTLLQTYSILHLTEFNVNAQPLNDFLCTRARLHTRFSVYLYVCIFIYVYMISAHKTRERDWNAYINTNNCLCWNESYTFCAIRNVNVRKSHGWLFLYIE